MGLRVYVGLAALSGAVVFASFGAIGTLPPAPSDLTEAHDASFEAPVTAAVKQDRVLPAPVADTTVVDVSLLSPQPIVLLLDQAMPVMATGAVQLANKSDNDLTASMPPAPSAPEPKKPLIIPRLEKDADPQSEISAYRKSHGLSAVTVDPKLTELARKQANAMAERRVLAHNVDASFRSRIVPYGSPSAVENIAKGTGTFRETFAIWKSSSSHKANLLLRNATRIGLASASAHGTTYWALILAAPAGRPASFSNRAAPAVPKRPSVEVLSVFPFVILMRSGSGQQPTSSRHAS
jgi:uncharacterized protein YkwD